MSETFFIKVVDCTSGEVISRPATPAETRQAKLDELEVTKMMEARLNG